MSNDSVVKESLTTQTAEEAAREWFNHDVIKGGDITLGIRSWLIWAGMNNGGDAIKKGYELGFERGMKLARESEKVLCERWVITFKDSEGKQSIINNALEVAKGWVWQVALKFREMPCSFTLEQRDEIARREAQGYRAVKVKLVEVKE